MITSPYKPGPGGRGAARHLLNPPFISVQYCLLAASSASTAPESSHLAMRCQVPGAVAGLVEQRRLRA